MKRKTIILLLMVIFIALLIIGVQMFSGRGLAAGGTEASKLKGKKILFLGDSLTNREKVDYNEAIKKPLEPNTREHYKYIDWVREMTGAVCYNYGYSGSSIARITSPNDPDPSSFISRYEGIIKKYTSPDAFDIIVIFGGVNDYMQSAPVSFFDNPDPYSFYGALKKVISEFQTAYPNSKIVLMNPLISTGEGVKFDFKPNGTNYVLQDYRKAIEEVARTSGVAHFPTEQLSGLNPSNPSLAKSFYFGIGDGVHPNPEGHKRIAVPLINFLEDLVY